MMSDHELVHPNMKEIQLAPLGIHTTGRVRSKKGLLSQGSVAVARRSAIWDIIESKQSLCGPQKNEL